MKKIKWILILSILLTAMPIYNNTTYAAATHKLKFKDIEKLVIEQNPTIKVNENVRRSLHEAKDALRDARDDKRDMEDAIDRLYDAIDGLNKIVKSQTEMINGLKNMSSPGYGGNGDTVPGERPGPEQEEGLDDEQDLKDEGDSEDEELDKDKESDAVLGEYPISEVYLVLGEYSRLGEYLVVEEGAEEEEEEKNDTEDTEEKDDTEEDQDSGGSDLDSGDSDSEPDYGYQELIGAQITTLEYLKILYESNISSLKQNIEAMEKQLNEFDKFPGKEMELEKAILQLDMGNQSIIWGSKNLYLGYTNLKRQRDELVENLELLDSQIDVMVIQEELGMITSLDLNGISNQRDQMILGINTLETQMNNLKGELNFMLGQVFNNPLEIEDVFTIDEEIVANIDYKYDLKIAKKNSYSVQLKDYDYNIQRNNMEWAYKHGSSDEYRSAKRDLENTKIQSEEEGKKVELTFYKAYQEMRNKMDALDNENKILEYEEQKYEILDLKYELGMISKIEFQQGEAEHRNQKNKTETVEQDAFQVLLKYEALLGGMDFMQ